MMLTRTQRGRAFSIVRANAKRLAKLDVIRDSNFRFQQEREYAAMRKTVPEIAFSSGKACLKNSIIAS